MTLTAKQIFDFIKLKSSHLVAVFCTCAVFLFSPFDVVEAIGFQQFTDDYRSWIGATFVASFFLLIVATWSDMVSIAKKIINRFYLVRRRNQRLSRLTEEEKEILRFYIFNETRTNSLSCEDGIVNGLISDGIIFQSSPVFHWTHTMDCNISEFAWDRLSKKKHLLLGKADKTRTDDPPEKKRRK